MKNNEQIIDKFIKHLKNNVKEELLVSIWNENPNNLYVYDIEGFTNITKMNRTLETIDKLTDGFSLNNKYFYICKRGKYHSFNRMAESRLPINWYILATKIIGRCKNELYVNFLEHHFK